MKTHKEDVDCEVDVGWRLHLCNHLLQNHQKLRRHWTCYQMQVGVEVEAMEATRSFGPHIGDHIRL